jgi:Fe-S cluster biogenesis protein NfuA
VSGATDTEGAAPDLRATGERIEALLDAASAGGIVARERAEELLRLVVELYGAGLERMLELLHERGRLDDVALDALAGDDLVSSLLLVHGLHPEDVPTRVARALDGVRPFLASHGGSATLLAVDVGGGVRVRLEGAGGGCGSSARELRAAIETAVGDAAPEITGVDIETPPTEVLIPVDSLRVRPGLTA